MGLQRGLRFSKVISSGNQGDLDTVAYLEYFGADPQTSVIGAYLEGIQRGREVMALAKEITKRKPVVIWKSGRSPSGSRAVASHTGSLAGSYQVTDAALRQAGVARAQNLEEMHDLLVAFSCPQLPRGKRVGVLVESGGGGAAAADACESLGLEIPTITQSVQDEIKAFTKGMIPPASGLANPVDLVWAPTEGADRLWAGSTEILAKAVDAVMVIMYYPFSDDKFGEQLAALRDRVGKPLIFLPGHPTTQVEGMAAYVRRGLPTYPTPERAARAIQALYQYASYLREVR
jgi:acetyltransferase